MKRVKMTKTTIDADGREVVEEQEAMLLPPDDPNICQTCNTDHPAGHPHKFESLYYQYAFLADHGRWPVWRDSFAHCDPQIQEVALRVLAKHGIDPDGGK